jgi:hypothetical protein
MPLPNFLVIGAYKSGTTALDAYLRQHPDVFLPSLKEPSYFAFAGGRAGPRPVPRAAVTDAARYARLFDGARGQRAVGEVSPEYLAHPGAAEAIRRELPDAKLVAVLRDPAERAYSDYLMYRRDGRERLDFGAALDAQAARAATGDPTGFYVATGFYGEQLARYFERFPAEQIRVHVFEDLVAAPEVVLADVFRFLGVDDAFVPDDLGGRNAGGIPRNAAHRVLMRARAAAGPLVRPMVPTTLRARIDRRLQRSLARPAMPAEARRRLVELYRDDVARLEGLIARDLHTWTEPVA